MPYNTQVITFTNDSGVPFTSIDAAHTALEAARTSARSYDHLALTEAGNLYVEQEIVDGAYVITQVMSEDGAAIISAAPEATFTGITVVNGAVGSVDTHTQLDANIGAVAIPTNDGVFDPTDVDADYDPAGDNFNPGHDPV